MAGYIGRAVCLFAASFLLTACYETVTPLITSENAAYPFMERIGFAVDDPNAERNVLWREGDHYVKGGALTVQPGEGDTTTCAVATLAGIEDVLMAREAAKASSATPYYIQPPPY